MCEVMQVSKSGYYKWLKRVPSNRSIMNVMIVNEIRAIHSLSKFRYGSPRITKELRVQGIKASQPLVAKLMRKENIRSIIRKKFKVTTNSNHKYPVVENKLMQDFNVKEQNEVWVSDITYIKTKQGWSYLTTVIDLFDRKVIGWALSKTMKAVETSLAALKMAVINRPVGQKELVFHSDRGIQYACEEFVNEVSKNKMIVRSMSRKGNCWDNAVAESFFKTLKVELVYHESYQTREQAELSIFEYIETWYNKRRRHLHLNNLTIIENENLMSNNLKHVA
jgi:transposase InsO family protein